MELLLRDGRNIFFVGSAGAFSIPNDLLLPSSDGPLSGCSYVPQYGCTAILVAVLVCTDHDTDGPPRLDLTGGVGVRHRFRDLL